MNRDDVPDPFAGHEDWVKAAERRARRERRQAVLRRAGPIVAGVVVLAVAVPLVRSGLSSDGDTAAAYPTQSVPAGESVVTTASAAPTDPFAGTPAAGYPKGRAGITLPPAKAVTGFTAAQVGAALRQVRTAMIAGRLDPGMLVGHRAAPFLALLAPNNRKGIGEWFTTHTAGPVATWIDPAVRLDPAEQPRVRGRVTYTSALVDDIRTLQITTNFVWVYAFTGAEHPLAAEHDQIRWEFPSTRNLRAGDHGMWLRDAQSYGALVDCDAAHRGLLAPTRPDEAGSTSAEDPEKLLEADHSLDIDGDCLDPSPAH
jgi:hypothetical protein